MLTKEITYEDFNGNKVTDTYYFYLSKSEMVELEASYEGGLDGTIKRIISTKDNAGLIREFKRLILMAYGEKSDDGKRFIKTEELRESFSQTAAYDALFMELATDDTAAADFIKGIVPKDVAAGIAEAEKSDQLPPPPISS